MKTIIYLFVLIILAVSGLFGFNRLAGPTGNDVQTTPAQQEEELKISPSPKASVEQEVTKQPPLPEQKIEKDVLLDVPFVVQAPKHNWKDPVYQNACEEAAILMAMRWVEGKTLTKEEAFVEIQKISDFSKKRYGFYLDQSAEDLAKLMREYFDYAKIRYETNVGISDIKEELFLGNLVLIPVNGQKLGNPFFTQPGPTEHMLAIKGYDSKTKEFITNDCGVGKGNGYRYKETVINDAMRVYSSGYKEKINEIEKAMIVIEK